MHQWFDKEFGLGLWFFGVMFCHLVDGNGKAYIEAKATCFYFFVYKGKVIHLCETSIVAGVNK